MKGIVAYSRPRGIYGRTILTTTLYFVPEEHAYIEVKREESHTAYSCSYCGRWASITTTTVSNINPTEHRQSGTIEFYRFDNVEPGDYMEMRLSDPELLFWQFTKVNIAQTKIALYHTINKTNPYLSEAPPLLYDIFLINWDEHMQQNSHRSPTVEEELIHKTMNGEPITIKELLLQPAEQPLALENGKHFIEGELKYL
jgi:hypothetical protein